jgi:hypothetical protein
MKMRILLLMVGAFISTSLFAQGHSLQLDDGAGAYSTIVASNPGGTYTLPPGGGTFATYDPGTSSGYVFFEPASLQLASAGSRPLINLRGVATSSGGLTIDLTTNPVSTGSTNVITASITGTSGTQVRGAELTASASGGAISYGAKVSSSVTDGSGTTYAVHADADGSAGTSLATAVYGTAEASALRNYGGQFYANNGTSRNIGVLASASGTNSAGIVVDGTFNNGIEVTHSGSFTYGIDVLSVAGGTAWSIIRGAATSGSAVDDVLRGEVSSGATADNLSNLVSTAGAVATNGLLVDAIAGATIGTAIRIQTSAGGSITTALNVGEGDIRATAPAASRFANTVSLVGGAATEAIANTLATAASTIIVTFQGNAARALALGPVIVTARAAGSFTIGNANGINFANTDIIHYMIINH